MSYDKTLLYSGNAGVSACSLSEPASAFEYLIIGGADNVERQCTIAQDNGSYKIPLHYGKYNTDSYMVWPFSLNVSNGTKNLTVNKFQLLFQAGTAAPKTFGMGNSASNVKKLKYVYGVNKTEPVSITGKGAPSPDWTEYNETLLWSSNNPSQETALNLSEPATSFDRLKVRVGYWDSNESNYIYDIGIPTDTGSYVALESFWGNTTASFYYCGHRYKFEGYNKMIPVSGKAFQLGTAAQNPYTATGNYTGTNTYIRYPVNAVWGINKKV